MKPSFQASQLRLLAVLVVVSLVSRIAAQNSDSDFPAPPPESDTTVNPTDFRTGKLNQFGGFFTPRPFPANANFVYASIWASWSAWSFCTSNVQIRVRACNTVRGFTCPGPNQERRSCGMPQDRPPFQQRTRPNNDYDTIDPYEEDRREALRQLYSDYTPAEAVQAPRIPVQNFGFKRRPVNPTENDFAVVQKSAGRTFNNGGGYGAGVGAPIAPPRDDSFQSKRQKSDGTGHAPSMTPELLFGSKLEVPLRRIKNKSKESNIEGIDSAASSTSNSDSKEATKDELIQLEEEHLEKVVPSSEFSHSPLKVGIEETPPETSTAAADEPTALPVQETEAEIPVKGGTAAPLTIELDLLSTRGPEENPDAEKPATGFIAPQILIKTSEILSPVDFSPHHHHAGSIKQVTKPFQKPSAAVPVGPAPEDSDLLAEGELYDDEVERTTASPVPVTTPAPVAALETTKSPEEQLRELEENIQQLEEETEMEKNDKLHSGEVVFTKDTEKALEWLISNMTKATELAIAQTHNKASDSNSNSVLEVDNDDRTRLHSGEVSVDRSDASGDHVGLDNAIARQRVFSSKTRKLVPIKPVRIDANKYDSLKIQQMTHLQPYLDTEKQELESDLIKLRNEMDRMKQELDHINSVPVETVRTTISPYFKALDLELVPKTPKINPGPSPIIISNNFQSSGFLIDTNPDKRGDALWSDWRPWNECFCDKQVRTRICNYDSGYHSRGCKGKSFESRPCESTRPCPAKIAAAQRLRTTTAATLTDTEGLYTLAPQKGHRRGYAFNPHPLSAAISENEFRS